MNELRLVCIREAAEMLGQSESAMRTWIRRGLGPKPIEVGGRKFFTVRLLSAFIQSAEERSLVRCLGAKAHKRPRGPRPLSVPGNGAVLFEKIRYRPRGVMPIAQGNEPLPGYPKNEPGASRVGEGRK